MASVTKHPKSFALRIQEVVKSGLASAGIKAITATESVPGTKLTRLIVMSSAFENLWASERQDLIWRILNQELTPEEQLKISMVVALSRKEVGAKLYSELFKNN